MIESLDGKGIVKPSEDIVNYDQFIPDRLAHRNAFVRHNKLI